MQLKPLKISVDKTAEVFQLFLRNRQDSLGLVLKLVEIMLVIGPSTAECECGFSKMNRIKNSVQNCLNHMED